MLAELTTKADFVTSLLLSVLILAGTETSAAAVFLTVMGLAGAGSSSPSSAESIFREVDDVFLQVFFFLLFSFFLIYVYCCPLEFE